MTPRQMHRFLVERDSVIHEIWIQGSYYGAITGMSVENFLKWSGAKACHKFVRRAERKPTRTVMNGGGVPVAR